MDKERGVVQGPGEEEDLCWGAFLLGGADDGCDRFEVILWDNQYVIQTVIIERGESTDTTPITPYPPSSAAFSILTALLSFIDGIVFAY